MRVSELLIGRPERGVEIGRCGLCGIDGSGFPLASILEKTSSNLTALFDLTCNSLCGSCRAVWSEPKKWHRSILATPGRVVFPVIARESVTDSRPAWSDAIRGLDASLPRVAVLTTDAKKRVWTFARVSQGEECLIYLYDPSRGLSGNVSVSLRKLCEVLTTIERVYSVGFTKDHIASSLLSYRKLCGQVGLGKAIALDRELSAIRSLPEFMPALIMAQKEVTNGLVSSNGESTSNRKP